MEEHDADRTTTATTTTTTTTNDNQAASWKNILLARLGHFMLFDLDFSSAPQIGAYYSGGF